MHLHTDDFFTAVSKGFIEPWQPESKAQNNTITNAIAAAAKQFALGGFDVVVDGVIGPWFLPEYQQALLDFRIDYVVLRPDQNEVAKRAREREVGAFDTYPPRIYDGFSGLGELEAHVIDSTLQSVPETLTEIRSGLATERFRLPSTQENLVPGST